MREESHLVLLQSQCSLNGAGGLVLLGPASAEVTEGRINGNRIGAVVCDGARLRIVRCDLTGNRDGPFHVDASSVMHRERLLL